RGATRRRERPAGRRADRARAGRRPGSRGGRRRGPLPGQAVQPCRARLARGGAAPVTWSPAQRTAAGSLLLAVAVATGFGGLVLAIARATGASDAARRAETAIATADSLERLVIDIETGQRGFVITRDESFLQPALRAERELPAVEERLRRVTGDDVAQQARVAGITRAIGTYESGYSRTLIAAARTEPARAVRIVAAGRGKRLV